MNTNHIPFLNDIDLSKVNYRLNKYKKNRTVHNQDSECYCIDIVLSGSLVAYALSKDGTESIVFNFKEGSVIGANLLFGEVNRYPLNIYCTKDAEVLSIDKKELQDLLKNYEFAMRFIKVLSINSQRMNERIAMSTQKNLRENILDYLSTLSIEQRSHTIKLPMSKKQLADYFGVKRPSLFRELKNLKDEGMIEVNNATIEAHFLKDEV